MLFVGVGTIWQIGLLTNCSSALDILISGRVAGFSGNLEQAARLRWRSFNRQKKNTVDCCLFCYISNNCKSPWSSVPIFHHCHQGQGQRRQKMMHLPPCLVPWLVGWLDGWWSECRHRKGWRPIWWVRWLRPGLSGHHAPTPLPEHPE